MECLCLVVINLKFIADEVYGQPTKSVWQANHSGIAVNYVNLYCFSHKNISQSVKNFAQHNLKFYV